jgi:hypothetical protein
MASLSDTLKKQREGVLKRGPGGQLSSETTEEVQQLAGQAGLAAPPITAIGTATIGGTPKQQDMAGSVAQKEAALSMAQAPVEQGLAGAVRRAQSRSQMTEQETEQKEKSQDMMNLGSLGTRVVGFIEAQKQKLQAQAQAVTPQATLAVAAQTTFQGKDVSGIKAKLDQFRKEPNNQQLLLEINQALGYDINTQLSPAQVDQLYQSATEAIASGAAGQVDNDLTVSDLVAQGDLGYTPTELSQLLGVPEQNLTGMTIGQLRSEIERVGQEEFNRTQQLGQQAQSGILGQAERGLAQSAGREMSATGVRATEADYANVEQQIQNADKVTFGGREYQVDELLQDETISNIVKDYLESSPDSEIRKQIDASEPALKEFIQKNQAVLAEASGAMQAGAQEFRATQEANKALATVGGIGMAPALAKALIPGFGTLQAQKIDPNSVPFLAAVNAYPPGRQTEAINKLNATIEEYPDVAQELAGLTKKDISDLAIGKKGSSFDKYLDARKLREQITNIPADDINSLVSIAFGETPDGFAQKQLAARRNGVFAVPTGLPIDISDVGNIKQGLLNATPEVSLKQATSGNVPSYQQQKLGKVQVPAPNTPEGYWMDLAMDLINDGSLDANDVDALSQRESKEDDKGLERMLQLEDMAGRPGAKVDRAATTSARQQFTDARTAREITNKGASGSPHVQQDNYMALLAEAKQDPRRLNPAKVEESLYNTVIHEINNPAGVGAHGLIAMGNKLTAAGIDTGPLRNSLLQTLSKEGYKSMASAELFKAFGLENEYNQLQAAAQQNQKQFRAKQETERKKGARGK